MARKNKAKGKPRRTAGVPPAKKKRQYDQGGVVVDPGIPCRHCGHKYGHTITNTYPNGNRRRLCGACGMPFVTVRAIELEPKKGL